MNSCRCQCRLSFVSAKEVGAVHKPALDLFVALGHALSSVQKLRQVGAVLEPALELVIGINLAVDFPEIR
jgi:hypothetical protein